MDVIIIIIIIKSIIINTNANSHNQKHSGNVNIKSLICTNNMLNICSIQGKINVMY